MAIEVNKQKRGSVVMKNLEQFPNVHRVSLGSCVIFEQPLKEILTHALFDCNHVRLKIRIVNLERLDLPQETERVASLHIHTHPMTGPSHIL